MSLLKILCPSLPSSPSLLSSHPVLLPWVFFYLSPPSNLHSDYRLQTSGLLSTHSSGLLAYSLAISWACTLLPQWVPEAPVPRPASWALSPAQSPGSLLTWTNVKSGQIHNIISLEMLHNVIQTRNSLNTYQEDFGEKKSWYIYKMVYYAAIKNILTGDF